MKELLEALEICKEKFEQADSLLEASAIVGKGMSNVSFKEFFDLDEKPALTASFFGNLMANSYCIGIDSLPHNCITYIEIIKCMLEKDPSVKTISQVIMMTMMAFSQYGFGHAAIKTDNERKHICAQVVRGYGTSLRWKKDYEKSINPSNQEDDLMIDSAIAMAKEFRASEISKDTGFSRQDLIQE